MTAIKPVRKFSLLLIDSSFFDREEVADLLSPLFSDIFFSFKDKAFSVFKEGSYDIVLAGSDSLEEVAKIREKNSKVDILLVGDKNSDTLLKALELHIYKYFISPLDPDELSKVVKELETKIFLRRAKDYNTFLLHQYKVAIDNSNIVSKTDINGIITYANSEFCKISKYTKEELIGQNHNIVRHPDIPKEVFERFWNTILNKKIWKGTVKNRAKDGKAFYLNTTVIPILDANNEIVEFVAIRYDVTKSVELQERLKKKEEELEKLNKDLQKKVKEQTKKLRELNANLEKRIEEEVRKNREKDRLMFQQARLASLGEMLGNIAHQWRQPLMELNLLLYKIKKSFENGKLDKAKMEELYKRSSFIIEKMSQTIIDFQNFFKPDKKYESFNILESIKYSVSIIEGSLKRADIKVSMESKGDIIVRGFQNEFSQVIINILNNAKDALKKIKERERKIEISVYREKSCFLYGEVKSEENAVIEIKDNGGGIDEKILDKIFEPYFTTKHSSQGTGLGLYMSKMIIEQSMKGILEAKNWEEGAIFTIRIPIFR